MYSVSYLLLLAANMVGVWVTVSFEGGYSHPNFPGVHCDEWTGYNDSDLEKHFRVAQGGNQDQYLQRFLIGNQSVYAGSLTHISNNCVEELVMDYDCLRFPQYLLQSTCKPTCKIMKERLEVLKLTPSESGDQGQEQYKISQASIVLSLCKNSTAH